MKEKPVTMFILAAAGAIMLTMLVSAPPVSAELPFETYFATFQQGVDGYFGTSDTYLRARGTDREQYNYGALDNTYIHGHAADGRMSEGLIKFDDIFGPNGIPTDVTGDDIINAYLTFGFYSGHADNDIRPFMVHKPWEAGNTANDYAADGESTAGYRFYREDGEYAPEDYWGDTGEFVLYPVPGVDYGDQEDPGSFFRGELSRNGPYDYSFEFGEGVGFGDLDITEAVRAWADGVENWGILVKVTQGTWGNYRYYSSNFEGDPEWRPKLTVEYIPEPSSLLLLGVGTMLTLMRRRH